MVLPSKTVSRAELLPPCGAFFSFPAPDEIGFLLLLFGDRLVPDKNRPFDGVLLPLGDLTLRIPSMMLIPLLGEESSPTDDVRVDGVALLPLLVGVDADAEVVSGVSNFPPVMVLLLLWEELP